MHQPDTKVKFAAKSTDPRKDKKFIPSEYKFTNNMLIRIVRMHFTEAGANEFLEIFNRHKGQIRSFSGCRQLQLLQDVHEKTSFTTLSCWDEEESLDRYRKSELFGKVWVQVKKLFARQPEAFSLISYIDVT